MSLGVIMLCHDALDRAAQVARHLAVQGCPVVVHLDARVRAEAAGRLRRALADLPDIRFCKRRTCEWGTWGLVAATQAAAEMLLRDFPAVRHVCLASGSCLPLRPAADLRQYLDARPGTDFIESVTTEDVGWTVGGLDIERFTLRFPFSWRRQRRLFDRYVALQRRLGWRRRIPQGVVPHLGSQWWCLTRATLHAILTDPRRPEFDAYFRRVWIPDESYFQSLVRRHSGRIESRSLTLATFDFQGKPHVFYDDHLPLLRRSGCFLARKIWPRADRLYDAFLSPAVAAASAAEPDPGEIDRLFAGAMHRRTKGRAGLCMQSRHPQDGWENGKTAGLYSVFEGLADVFEDFPGWIGRTTGARIHGHLFAPARVEFAGGEAFFRGALSDSAALRDYNPRCFLTSLIWNTRGERQAFLFGPGDRQDIGWFLATDPNAQIALVTGAWAVPLFRKGGDPAQVRRVAAQLQKTEARHLEALRSTHARARVRVWSLAEILRDPVEPLQSILDDINPRAPHRLVEVPRLVDLTGFGRFLKDLRDQGMPPMLIGDVPAADPAATVPGPLSRPHLVG
jgi:hypothetical protein